MTENNDRAVLIDANRSLLAQIEVKSIELRQLNELVAQLEATNQKHMATHEILLEKLHQFGASGHNSPVNNETSENLNDDETKIMTETDSLQDLIVNYLSLIKSYKQLVEQLDQARIDNSELKISYNSLNNKYMRLKSNETTNGEINEQQQQQQQPLPGVDRTEIDTYKSLIDDKYRQQISNLKSGYNQMYELYEKTKNESYERYNRLHAEYLKQLKSKTNEPATNNENL